MHIDIVIGGTFVNKSGLFFEWRTHLPELVTGETILVSISSNKRDSQYSTKSKLTVFNEIAQQEVLSDWKYG
ncbi:hypothetical protein NDU88_005035 [Pleurodeles waltl]|uniref:Uncharacterized protein n=1 Tax=Pleurodeles waltl TaxID=8319 RepID=A0AAV7WXI6_PLEWA|nr:hypothetical protein NDU88_005035 [Pleurodeles waltl]